jgi:hypothetical protein
LEKAVSPAGRATGPPYSRANFRAFAPIRSLSAFVSATAITHLKNTSGGYEFFPMLTALQTSWQLLA